MVEKGTKASIRPFGSSFGYCSESGANAQAFDRAVLSSSKLDAEEGTGSCKIFVDVAKARRYNAVAEEEEPADDEDRFWEEWEEWDE